MIAYRGYVKCRGIGYSFRDVLEQTHAHYVIWNELNTVWIKITCRKIYINTEIKIFFLQNFVWIPHHNFLMHMYEQSSFFCCCFPIGSDLNEKYLITHFFSLKKKSDEMAYRTKLCTVCQLILGIIIELISEDIMSVRINCINT